MKTVVDIFIAYSHNDLQHKEELKKFLRPLLNTGRAKVWDDYDIEAGHDWEAEIKKSLYGADIILLLVSPDSLASDYFYGQEVAVSLERHEKGEAVVVPVILRPCAWTMTPLSKIEALPPKGKPVTKWSSQDDAFTEVAHSLGEIAGRILEQQQKLHADEQQRRQFLAVMQAAQQLYAQSRWVEAGKAYTDALLAFRPGYEPSQEDLQSLALECENLAAKEAIEAENSRRKALFEQAYNQAEGLHSSSRWAEAQTAWKEAKRLYEPDFMAGFNELVQMRIADCKSALKLESDYNNHISKAQKYLSAQSWTRAASEATLALKIRPEDETALEIIQQTKTSLANIDDASPSSILLHIRKYWLSVASILLLIIAIAWYWPFIKGEDNTQEELAKIAKAKEESLLLKAQKTNTIPAWQEYIDSFPQGAHLFEANNNLKELNAAFRNNLNDARLFIEDSDYENARAYIQDALVKWPNNGEAIKILETIKEK